MAQNLLTPNLDDGELWLPSDIFINEVSSKRSIHHPFSCMDMDNLAHRFSVLSLLQHAQPKTRTLPKIAPTFERFKQPVYGSVNPLVPGQFVFNSGASEVGQRPHWFGAEPCSGGAKPVYGFHVRKPTQTQVQNYLRARTRLLRGQENRVGNWASRLRGINSFGVGGFAKESCGTGVFHPRINPTATRITSGSGMLHGVRRQKPQETQLTQQRNSMTRAGGMREQEDDCYYHLPPEMGLPRDWTY